jgi:hypothetical protein
MAKRNNNQTYKALTDLTSGTFANLTVTNPIVGSITGNAATATLASSAVSMFGQYDYSASTKSYDNVGSVVPKYGSPNISTNNASGVAYPDYVYFNLIHISKAVTINKILSFCGTSGGGSGDVKYGIYSVSSIGYPDQKLYGSGSISFTGVQATQISVSGVATTLSAGWYFLAATYSATAGAGVYSLATQGFSAFGQAGAFIGSVSRAMYYDDSGDLAYGFTLQTSYPTATNMLIEKGTPTTRMPALYFEVA